MVVRGQRSTFGTWFPPSILRLRDLAVDTLTHRATSLDSKLPRAGVSGIRADPSSLDQVGGRETVGKVEARGLDMARVSQPYSQVLACPSGGQQSHFPGEANRGGRLVLGKNQGSDLRLKSVTGQTSRTLWLVSYWEQGRGAGSGLRSPSSHAWPEVEGTGRD